MESNVWDDISENYAEEIISPLIHGDPPIIKQKLETYAKKFNRVIELGCGTGPLLPMLAKNFLHITATDGSEGMIAKATERLEKAQLLSDNIQLKVLKHDQIYRINEKFELLIAINSLLSSDLSEVDRIAQHLGKLAEDDAIFLAVLPSWESLRAEYLDALKKEWNRHRSEEKAKEIIHQKFQIKRIDFELGTYDTGDMVQKYFNGWEIKDFCKKAGFEILTWEKIKYPESFRFNFAPRPYSKFPRMWDWFIEAKKISI